MYKYHFLVAYICALSLIIGGKCNKKIKNRVKNDNVEDVTSDSEEDEDDDEEEDSGDEHSEEDDDDPTLGAKRAKRTRKKQDKKKSKHAKRKNKRSRKKTKDDTLDAGGASASPRAASKSVDTRSSNSVLTTSEQTGLRNKIETKLKLAKSGSKTPQGFISKIEGRLSNNQHFTATSRDALYTIGNFVEAICDAKNRSPEVSQALNSAVQALKSELDKWADEKYKQLFVHPKRTFKQSRNRISPKSFNLLQAILSDVQDLLQQKSS